jgi:hypothetical protein
LNGLKLSSGKLDAEVLAYFRGAIAERKGDAAAMAGFGYSMYGAIQRGGDIGPLASDSITAMEVELKGANSEIKPALYNAIALLHDATGNSTAAIKAQRLAVKNAPEGRQKDRMQQLLDELVEQAAEDGDNKETDKE